MSANAFDTGSRVPTDIITYRLGSTLVYVRPADDYEQALDYAKKEFPHELAELERSRISFYINAKLNGQHQPVRISASAWPATVARLLRGEVVDVVIEPPPVPSDSKYAAPPQYQEVPQPHSASASLPEKSLTPPSPKLMHSVKTKRSWFSRH